MEQIVNRFEANKKRNKDTFLVDYTMNNQYLIRRSIIDGNGVRVDNFEQYFKEIFENLELLVKANYFTCLAIFIPKQVNHEDIETSLNIITSSLHQIAINISKLYNNVHEDKDVFLNLILDIQNDVITINETIFAINSNRIVTKERLRAINNRIFLNIYDFIEHQLSTLDHEVVRKINKLIYTLTNLGMKDAEDLYNRLKKKESYNNFKEDITNEDTTLFGQLYKGGKKSKKQPKKEILGVMRCIYKLPDDRKEYVKHKGKLITIKDFKEFMKPKKQAKPKKQTKAKKRTKTK